MLKKQRKEDIYDQPELTEPNLLRTSHVKAIVERQRRALQEMEEEEGDDEEEEADEDEDDGTAVEGQLALADADEEDEENEDEDDGLTDEERRGLEEWRRMQKKKCSMEQIAELLSAMPSREAHVAHPCPPPLTETFMEAAAVLHMMEAPEQRHAAYSLLGPGCQQAVLFR